MSTLNCPLCKRGRTLCSCECGYCGAALDWDGRDWFHVDVFEDEDHAPSPHEAKDLVLSHLELAQELSNTAAEENPSMALVFRSINVEMKRLIQLLISSLRKEAP